MRPTLPSLRRPFAPPGLSLIEVALSVVVLAFVTVGAARTVAVARVSDQLTTNRAQARMLADALMSEILVRPYSDPQGPTALTVDSGENQNNRSTLDDIDDFNGYNEGPIKNTNGTAVAELAAWSRTVAVQWVRSADYTDVSGSETDVKRIIVTVKRSGRSILSATAIRCRGREAVQ
jgi:MSHA pilin protein MshD